MYESLDNLINGFGGNWSTVTLNPSDKSANITLSGGDLVATATNTAWKSVRGTHGHSTGKRQFEVTITTRISYVLVGIGTSGADINNYLGYDYLGHGLRHDSLKFNTARHVTYNPGYVQGNIIGVCVDFDIGTLQFYKNGVPMDNTFNICFMIGSVKFYPMLTIYANNDVLTANFGATSFSYPVTGYIAWNIGFRGI